MFLYQDSFYLPVEYFCLHCVLLLRGLGQQIFRVSKSLKNFSYLSFSVFSCLSSGLIFTTLFVCSAVKKDTKSKQLKRERWTYVDTKYKIKDYFAVGF